jgi:hypothetical protein
MRATLNQHEFPVLLAAQLLAASTKNYYEWIEVSRRAFTFGVSVRMARAMHYDKPCENYWIDMRDVGQRLLRELESEKVNYEFGDVSSAADGDREAPAEDHRDGHRDGTASDWA